MNQEIMYTIGMIFGAVYRNEDMHMTTLDYALKWPVKGIGLLRQRPEFKKADQQEIAALMDKLPVDLADTPKGVPLEHQGPFWIGYYHYSTHCDQSRNYGPDELTNAGKALYGARWQTDLARDLGLHDGRRIRQWLSGDRKIPPSVWGDIAGLLRHRQLIIGAALDDIVK